jgi:hypothetical protein
MTTTKDPDRLRVAGSAEARALLAAAPATPPQQLHDDVRAAVEARWSARGRRLRGWRLLLVGGGLMFGGTALAFVVVGVRARLASPPVPIAVPAPRSAEDPMRQAERPEPEEAPAPGPTTGGEPAGNRSSRRSPVAEPARRISANEQPFGGPGLAWPPGRFGGEVDSPKSHEGPSTQRPASPSRVVIAREGRREIAIAIEGTRIVGRIRDAAVALEIVGQRILGKLGDENVFLLQHGTEAEGTIANHGVGFQLSPTPTGHLIRGSVPAHTTRVEMTPATLSYHPGCDDPLTLVAPNTYAGTCGGGQTRVILPAAWQQLPALTRFILLSLILPERDPGLSDDPPALFGPPDWPKRE